MIEKSHVKVNRVDPPGPNSVAAVQPQHIRLRTMNVLAANLNLKHVESSVLRFYEFLQRLSKPEVEERPITC